MTDRVDELIKEIAVKHGVAVGRNDPLLVLHTMIDHIMEDAAKDQRQAMEEFKSELEQLTQRWSFDAKEKAERILNAAIAASKQSMLNSMQEGAKVAAEAIRSEVESALIRPIAEARRHSVLIAKLNIAAGACLVIATLVLAFVR